MTAPGERAQTGVAEAAGAAALPRVGVVAALFDPEDERVWSGVPHNVVAELRRLGLYAGTRRAMPWPRAARAMHRWMQLTGRAKGWGRRAEMRLLTTLSDWAIRRKPAPGVDGWIHFVSGNGPVTRDRYVTLFEMSPKQLMEAATQWKESLGYPYATKGQMRWVAKRQVLLYRNAHACCVASRWAADSLVADHGIDARKIRIVGYGTNVRVSPPPDRDWSSPRFLFVGWDWRRKNGDAVVRSFRRLREDLPEARLDVVGAHPPLDVDGVTGHGDLGVYAQGEVRTDGRARLAELFAAATCLVMPSFCEPWGIVYVEAAEAGIPSIGTSVGGTADSIGDGGIRVDPYDDDALYAAMRRLADPATARAMGAQALARSRRYTWQAMGQRVLRSLDLGPIPGVELADFL